MPPPGRGPLPSMRSLRVFESAGRMGNFSRAARELHTTQSAVSRTIADLERRLSTRLFERNHRSVRLTEAGEILHVAVVAGLARIGAGVAAATASPEDRRIVIACGHATSEMFLLPRFQALRRTLGEDAAVRVLTCDYDMVSRLGDTEADLILTYDATGSTAGDRVVAIREEVTAVCAPGFAAAHAETLARPVTEWNALTFLTLARPTRGWVIWDDWFDAVGRPRPEPRYEDYDDYVYLVEAAAAGRGLALGWREFIGRHVDSGALVAVMDGFIDFDRPHFAMLTARGRQRAIARRCLDFFASRPAASPAAGANRTRVCASSDSRETAATESPTRFAPERRRPAPRRVSEHQGDDDSRWVAGSC